MKNLITHLKSSILQQATRLLVISCILIDLISPAMAENTITSGTTLRVSAGTTLVNVGALTIKSGGILTNLGTVNVSGNLDNQNSTSSVLGSGTIQLTGTSLQNVNGQNTFGNLTVNNAAGIALNGNTTVNGTMTFTNGRVTIGSDNLLFGSSSAVAGTPSATAMVVATGKGEVRKSFAAAGSFTFPVGDNTGTVEYSPVTLAFTGGSYGSGNYAGVNLVNAQYPGSPSTGSYLNRYWAITQSGISGYSCNATLQYLPADVTGTESSIYCVRLTPTSVTYHNIANTTLHQLTANGLTTLGTFTGSQTRADKNLNLTLFLEGLYNGSGTMRKAQNGSGDQFAGNIADQIIIELHNSSSYSTIVYSLINTNLSTLGAMSAIIPGIHSGLYYVTIKHRNSITTTTASPVSLAGSSINYNFDNPLKAYGNNLIAMAGPGTYYAIYAGDVTQDGLVDSGDMTPVDNLSSAFGSGYIPEDANGDGIIDSGDLTIIDNNATGFVGSVTP